MTKQLEMMLPFWDAIEFRENYGVYDFNHSRNNKPYYRLGTRNFIVNEEQMHSLNDMYEYFRQGGIFTDIRL